MNYNYLQRSHNKIYKRKNIIYKFFKSPKKYFIERVFYLNSSKLNIDIIPKLYYFSDKRFCIIIENVGCHITKKEFISNQEIIKELYNVIVSKTGYYHNDLYYKNVCKKNNNYYIIDFESASHFYKDIHKKSKELYIN